MILYKIMSWWPGTLALFFYLYLGNGQERRICCMILLRVAITRAIQLLYIWFCKERLGFNLCLPSPCVSKFTKKSISRKKIFEVDFSFWFISEDILLWYQWKIIKDLGSSFCFTALHHQ